MPSVTSPQPSRAVLLRRLRRLAPRIVFGTLAATYRRCGRARCHCAEGPKHGPHLFLSFRGPSGRTQAFYVPQALQGEVRAGVAAWHELQQILRALGDRHRQQLWAARQARIQTGPSRGRSHGPAQRRPAHAR